MTVLTRATMPGALRNGAERGGGTLVHLIENPDGKPAYNLGRDALCGRGPSIMWSDWAPETMKVCPRCAKKALQISQPKEFRPA